MWVHSKLSGLRQLRRNSRPHSAARCAQPACTSLHCCVAAPGHLRACRGTRTQTSHALFERIATCAHSQPARLLRCPWKVTAEANPAPTSHPQELGRDVVLVTGGLRGAGGFGYVQEGVLLSKVRIVARGCRRVFCWGSARVAQGLSAASSVACWHLQAAQ